MGQDMHSSSFKVYLLLFFPDYRMTFVNLTLKIFGSALLETSK